MVSVLSNVCVCSSLFVCLFVCYLSFLISRCVNAGAFVEDYVSIAGTD